MRKIYNLKLIVFIVTALALSSCQHYNKNGKINVFPPESDVVMEGGSIPEGFNAALRTGGIDPDCITCNSQNRYGNNLKASSDESAKKLFTKLIPYLKSLNTDLKKELSDELEDHIMWAMVRGVLIEGNNNNLGAIVLKGKFWTDEKGIKHPVVVFRTAFTPDPARENSCYRSLLDKGMVKHVINLYDGEMELDDLIKGERDTAKEFGASYVRTAELDYGKWRYTIRKHPEPGKEREKATENLARLIKEQILMPNGKPPGGNILVHCGGGMHRTGMVIGILQKVVNNDPMEKIKSNYSYHVGYRNKDNPGGFEQGNLDFIADFPPELLLKF